MKHTLSRLAVTALLLSSIPWTAFAAPSIHAADAIAGLGTTIELSGMPPQKTLTALVATPEQDITVPVETNAAGDASFVLSPVQTEIAGTYAVSMMQGSTTLGTATFAVQPDTIDPALSELLVLQKAIEPDGVDQAIVIVTLRDQYGNPLAGRPVTLVPGRASDMVATDGTETDDNGEQRFYISTIKPGVITLRALDLLSGVALPAAGSISAGSAELPTSSTTRFAAQVSGFGEVVRLELNAPATMEAGVEAPKVSVRAVDANGETVEDYVGTVLFDAPNDPSAILPGLGQYTFKEADLGDKDFPIILTFLTAGEQVLRVEDKSDPRIYDEETITVTGSNTHPAAGDITVTSPRNGDMVHGTQITVEGTGPRLTTLVVSGGEQEETGDTGTGGTFSIPITLESGKTSFTLRVRDESNRYDSGPINITLDTSGPAIEKVTLAPATPGAGEQVLVTVEAEPRLKSVTARLPGDEATTLVEMTNAQGRYQGFITAPRTPGSYQPIITATNEAGGMTEVRATMNVVKAGVAKVQNVQAEGKISAVALTWDRIESGVDGYRVYVGDSPVNFLYTLDTGRDVGQAIVAGLNPGTIYHFAVTALKSGDESTEKSDIVQARTLGLVLEVLPQDASLVLKWPDPATQLPLSSYLLEYGVQEGKYTERRLINGALKEFTVHDLLNGVEYFLRLTPITITGDQLNDLAASGRGTPNGSGFAPGPGDPIPFDPGRFSGTTGKPAILNQTGVPDFVLWLGASLALACGAGVWYATVNARRNKAFLRALQSRYV